MHCASLLAVVFSTQEGYGQRYGPYQEAEVRTVTHLPGPILRWIRMVIVWRTNATRSSGMPCIVRSPIPSPCGSLSLPRRGSTFRFFLARSPYDRAVRHDVSSPPDDRTRSSPDKMLCQEPRLQFVETDDVSDDHVIRSIISVF